MQYDTAPQSSKCRQPMSPPARESRAHRLSSPGMAALLLALLNLTLAAPIVSAAPKASEIHYQGALNGTASFKSLRCTLRAGRLVGLSDYAAIGKALGPNVALFTTNDDGTGQHLGFVPSGKSQQADYFNARASGTIPGLDTSAVATTGTITLHHVALGKPGLSGNQLTLDGTLICTSITR